MAVGEEELTIQQIWNLSFLLNQKDVVTSQATVGL